MIEEAITDPRPIRGLASGGVGKGYRLDRVAVVDVH